MTIVAAWISADTGVGPSIASGSQTYSGICALLPVAPTNSSRQIVEIAPNPAASTGIVAAASATARKSSVPNVKNTRNIPRMNPQSPIRFVMKAFLPASDALFFSYQNPISRYEQSPTPSQPTNITRKLPPSTRVSMKKQNRFR